jgi:2-polyprenyl-3-methyl-5-hydroxy-6-metoxy-1,4-benzoquinol methylase
MKTLLKKIVPRSIKKVIDEYVANVADRQIGEQSIKSEDTAIYMQQALSLLQLKGIVPPIPPPHLQVRVSNRYYGEFFVHGSGIIRDVEQILSSSGRNIRSFERILDFGCGCGRTLIPLSFCVDPENLYGTDIDEEAIGWLKDHYAFANLFVNGVLPPTGFESGMFDFIYSISIFTHLPEDMQFPWLDELRRIVKKGGYVAVSTHGDYAYSYFSSDTHNEFRKKGFFYFAGAEETKGLPSFYKAAFHSIDYIRKEWSRYFTIAEFRPRGISDHQDLLLLQRKEP